jgi:hypothetical protein
VEAILGKEEVWSSEARVMILKGITFDPTIGSRSNFYRGFIGHFPWS